MNNDIGIILQILQQKYPRIYGVPGGFKMVMREDGDVYIYLPSPDGDGWYIEHSFDTLPEFIKWLEDS